MARVGGQGSTGLVTSSGEGVEGGRPQRGLGIGGVRGGGNSPPWETPEQRNVSARQLSSGTCAPPPSPLPLLPFCLRLLPPEITFGAAESLPCGNIPPSPPLHHHHSFTSPLPSQLALNNRPIDGFGEKSRLITHARVPRNWENDERKLPSRRRYSFYRSPREPR